MNFVEAQEYLFSLGNEVESMKLGLDNIRKLLTGLGNPENKYLKVQVAGTNGKGSVCAFLNSICLEAGIKTGLYTSPHLMSVTERVKINGIDISDDEFGRIATIVRRESEKLVADGILENVPTFFEQVTALALLAFAQAGAQLAILETGLGGRFDAVTAAKAEICAITRIDYDHQNQLGGTIEEIAAEKAAIIHNGSKVVVGEQNEKAKGVILSRCRQVGIEPKFAQEILAVTGRNTTGRECAAFSIRKGAHLLPLVFPPVCLGLLGKHQIENVQIALSLTETLRESFAISNENLSAGIENASHPGRLEWIDNFLLDGAHNVGGAKALAAYVDEFVEKPTTLIFGAMRDKNVAEIAETLWPRVKRIILTTPNNSRALSAEELLKSKPANLTEIEILKTPCVDEAVRIAKELAGRDEVILVTGSLYLVGEARDLLTRDGKQE